jgi:lysophospholipase L1-like esterase
MTPVKVLLTILSLFLTLGVMALAYPEDGIHIGDTTLRYPKLSQVFEKAETTTDSAGNEVKVEQVDPEEAIRQMMEETKAKQFAAFSDSLKYYEDFFREGRTRFELPNDDLTWFDRFFQSLQNAQKDSTTVHVIHYGDSQLEEDRISSTIREDLQTEFGGNGPGLLPAVMHIPSQSTSQWNNGNMQRYIIFGPKEEQATHNRYGPLAQVGELNGSAVVGIKKRENKKDMFPHVGGYSTIKVLAGKKGNLKLRLTYEHMVSDSVGVNADGSTKYKLKNKKETAEAPAYEEFTKLRVYTWKLPDTTSNIKLYMSGRTEIYGISVDGAYGVAVDNVAMRGSSGTIFHKIDSQLLAESYKAMNAKLIIMEYGGNLVPGMTPKGLDYNKNLITRQIKAVQRANPDADILFIGPAHMAKQINGRWQTYPGLGITIKMLREVALENGLAYWDMHRVMGGEGSMIKWVKKSPPLGFTDHVHFTRRGAAYMGDLFCSSLHMYYDYYQFRGRHNLNDSKLKDIRKYSDKKKTDADTTKVIDLNAEKAKSTKTGGGL